METLKIMCILIAVILVVMSSCKKKSSEETTSPPAAPTVNAKWIVGGVEAAQFTSFEFNKSGQYIVMMPAGVSYGNYSISGVSMVLDNFGDLTVTKLTNTELGFILTMPKKSGKTEYTISTTKAQEIPATGNTALLCRTWNLDSINHESVVGTPNEIQALFTPAGTYFIHYVYNNSNAGALWKWLDSKQDMLCYGWEGSVTCNGDQECKIDKLTATKLVMSEVSFDCEYSLSPYTTKSMISPGPVRYPKPESNLLGK
jgi:hypothetical protein